MQGDTHTLFLSAWLQVWRERVKAYEHSFAASVEELKVVHEQQQHHLHEQLQARLKLTPRPSKVGVTNGIWCV